MTTPMTLAAYPVRFNVDFPEVPRNRLTIFLRIFAVIPVVILLALLEGATGSDEAAVGSGGVSVAVLLMLLFRQKYPRWWFDWLVALNQFGARIGSYVLLQRDEYPSTDEEQAVHLEIDYPDATQLNRWLPLVKWLLALPHFIVLFFLWCAVVLATIFVWLAILVTGRTPVWAFNFVVGVQRWTYRVTGYAVLLVTDRYPPFSLA